jgi:hypothetical protein
MLISIEGQLSGVQQLIRNWQMVHFWLFSLFEHTRSSAQIHHLGRAQDDESGHWAEFVSLS